MKKSLQIYLGKIIAIPTVVVLCLIFNRNIAEKVSEIWNATDF